MQMSLRHASFSTFYIFALSIFLIAIILLILLFAHWSVIYYYTHNALNTINTAWD